MNVAIRCLAVLFKSAAASSSLDEWSGEGIAHVHRMLTTALGPPLFRRSGAVPWERPRACFNRVSKVAPVKTLEARTMDR